MNRWAILTGEYPPQAGGVADYTQLLATALAATGDEVMVYGPPLRIGGEIGTAGVGVTRLPDIFSLKGLLLLERELCRTKANRILIQYVPHSFGFRGLNVMFAAWAAWRAPRYAPVWVMFHEVYYPRIAGQPLRHHLLSRVTVVMARLLAGSAQRLFVSIPAWGPLLGQVCRRAMAVEWLPVPSTVPTSVEKNAIEHVSSRLRRSSDMQIIGHFGTYGSWIDSFLMTILPALLEDRPGRIALLLGFGAGQFSSRLIQRHPTLIDQVVHVDGGDRDNVAAHLAASDVLIQPYPDGASARRTTLMAGLALGIPVVTNLGDLSESMWRLEAKGVELAQSATPAAILAAAEKVLAASKYERAALGRAGAAWYRERFSLEQIVEQLRADDEVTRAGPPREVRASRARRRHWHRIF